ncbi:protein-glutamate methylesterase/protein-glutamine glutaminase [Phenylobacterium soli]|uniref:Protein-glutamate methylesterase/protein-glutamine glutaminase n=1 Tax=Phenylobacterium soli TaxID=2170551 RepID=A0A328AN13_9CAUL|nr:chemotaxis response regulator protein-glutamate methylesterase [Phenylobacterium soli]RAK54814.1 chemotaxis response regulator protein-glutamate methylesterase [Phenylobacterium soli]
MVVDDSAVVRGLVSRQLATDSAIEVVCTASNGEIALREMERHEVDIVVLDIEMPVMDGLTALTRILKSHPHVEVIMASTLTRRNAEVSLKALQLGASDYVAKPETGLAGAAEFQRELVSKIKALGARKPVRAAPAPAAAPAPRNPLAASWPRPPATPASRRVKPQVLAIGASTGGPPALIGLFEALRGAVPQPILLTQHMPATFTALLAEQLSRAGERPCAEAKDGESIEPGRCYVAPGGWHMTVGRAGPTPVIRLNQDPPENFCRPAVDPMLRSIARVYGPAAIAVILTGMGADGAKGCEAISAAGGHFIAQDEATSVVWGMPGAAAATGLADAILPIGEVAPWIRRQVEVGA